MEACHSETHTIQPTFRGILAEMYPRNVCCALDTFVFKATPEGYTEIGVNKLGDEAFATPTICGDRIYMRVASQVGGKRQETLYCIGKKE